jgi:hypothetical protein
VYVIPPVAPIKSLITPSSTLPTTFHIVLNQSEKKKRKRRTKCHPCYFLSLRRKPNPISHFQKGKKRKISGKAGTPTEREEIPERIVIAREIFVLEIIGQVSMRNVPMYRVSGST